MHALTTTRQLLQEVRDLHEREDVPQQPKQSKQSKRRRMEDIKSQAIENLLTVIVEANIEMHGLFMHELRMHELFMHELRTPELRTPEHRELALSGVAVDTVTPLEERGTHAQR